nr:hypothetical protein [Tanacetum cinerariifolium]
METEDITDRYAAPCFINGLEACDEEDDVEPGVVLGRPFMHLTKGIVDFGKGIITDLLLDDLDFGYVLEIEGVEIPSFMCKIGKNSRNKRKKLEKYQLIYSDMGPSSSIRKSLTQEEAAREALAIDICRRFSILEEERPMKKEEEEAIIKVKGKALIEKEDRGAFIIPIRLEGKTNLNSLADTGSDINVMPYRVYKELGREQVTDVKRANTSLNTKESESDDQEDYGIQRNNFGEPMYGPKPAKLLTVRDGGRSDASMCPSPIFALGRVQPDWNVLKQMGCCEAINEMLKIKLCLGYKFYSTYKFDEICVDDKLRSKKIIKFRLYGCAFSWTLQEFAKSDEHFNAQEYWLSISQEENLSLSRSHALTIRNPVLRFITKIAKRKNLLSDGVVNSLSALIYYRALDTTTLRELIDSEARLIPEVPELGVPRFSIPRSLRVSMQDLYEGTGSMEIRQGVIERMSYRQSYH